MVQSNVKRKICSTIAEPKKENGANQSRTIIDYTRVNDAIWWCDQIRLISHDK